MSGKRGSEEAFGRHDLATPHSPKRKRRMRKYEDKSSKSEDATAVMKQEKQAATVPTQPELAGTIARHKKSSKHKNSEHNSAESKSKKKDRKGWTLSTGTGGVFLNHDPIITEDEKYLILPTASSVQVYSTSTSLLVRTLDIGDGHFITSCCLSSKERTELLISSSRGVISKWNWTTGRQIYEWRCRKYPIWILTSLGTEGDLAEHVMLLNGSSEAQSEVLRCRLDTNFIEPATEKTILSNSRPFSPTLRASADGRILVIYAADTLFLGQSDQTQGNPEELSYTWRQATIPGLITSVDARFRKEKTTRGTRTAVDVVLGLKDGAILIYDDLLFGLIGKEKGSKTTEISSRRLHWHRDSVRTVKWSHDGNYLISGGNETVLVLWQLDTNQKQFLPHLSTAILNLTVSASGSSYALRLADNSVMVLSTADLKPYANVSNLAVNQALANHPPAVFHPQIPCQLIAAVPRVSITGHHQNDKSSATMLQTYDIGAGLQINRQALTRNVTTMLNVAPTGQKIVEPDVILLQVTHDGQWLVTVDEWSQPDPDLDPLYPISDKMRTKSRPKETCLRFWRWSEDARSWEQVTRVNAPHQTAAVLGIAVNPARQEVATVDGAGGLRIWSPKLRHRSGLPVKDQSGQQLRNWTCSNALQVERKVTSNEQTESGLAKVAYSEDGSVIAASWSKLLTDSRLVHFIDSLSGTLRHSQPNLLAAGNAEIAFLGRYLLCLSQSFYVWDIVNSKAAFAVALADVFQYPDSPRLLAVNKTDGTFALVLNTVHIDGSAQVAVFDIQQLKGRPVCQMEIRGHVKLLLPQPNTSGFVLVDEQNRIRKLMPPASAGLLTSLVSAQHEEVRNSLNNIFGSGMAEKYAVDNDGGEKIRGLPAAERLSAIKSVEGLFDLSKSSKGRSVEGLFEQVAELFARPSVATQ